MKQPGASEPVASLTAPSASTATKPPMFANRLPMPETVPAGAAPISPMGAANIGAKWNCWKHAMSKTPIPMPTIPPPASRTSAPARIANAEPMTTYGRSHRSAENPPRRFAGAVMSAVIATTAPASASGCPCSSTR